MELREYMSIRRSYNLVRRVVPANRRLTFEEFAILCRLNVKGAPVKTSEIAECSSSYDYSSYLAPGKAWFHQER